MAGGSGQQSPHAPSATPSVFTTSATPSVFTTSVGAFNSGVGSMERAASPTAVGMTMNQFANPYQQSVLNAITNQSNYQEGMDLNQLKAQATQAGAYGGGRYALADATLRGDYNRNLTGAIANASQQGFNTQAGLAEQDLGRASWLGSSLTGAAQTGYGLGSSAISGMNAAGTQQQNLYQQILAQAAGQTQGGLNYPQQALATASAALQGNPLSGNVSATSAYQPGLLDYASAIGKVAGSGK